MNYQRLSSIVSLLLSFIIHSEANVFQRGNVTLEICCEENGEWSNKAVGTMSIILGGSLDKYCLSGMNYGSYCDSPPPSQAPAPPPITSTTARTTRKIGGTLPTKRSTIVIPSTAGPGGDLDYEICDLDTDPDCDTTGVKPEDDLIDEWMRFCRRLDDQPMECRNQSECRFICGDRRCDVKQNIKSGTGYDCSCSRHCFDPVSCKLAGCEYQTAGGNCRDGNQVCSSSDFEDWQCVRKNVLYASGGEICKNYDLNTPNTCHIEKTITAVNFNGDRIIDSQGIVFEAHEDVPRIDPHNLEVRGEIGNERMIFGVPAVDKSLYATYIHGGGKQQPGLCISYDFFIQKDGIYDIILKAIEPYHSVARKRLFNIKLNNLLVIPELDVISYTAKRDYGVDIIIPFQIQNDRRILKVKGFKGFSVEPGEHFNLAFCYGEGPKVTPDINFVISGFAIVKYGEGAETLCKRIPADSPCPCKEQACEYNSAIGMCTDIPTSCSEVRKSSENECRRANAYYSNAGVLCRNHAPSDTGNCKVAQTTWAVNLNGDSYTDSRGIHYIAEATLLQNVMFPIDYRLPHNALENCAKISGVGEMDGQKLFATAIKGNPSENGTEKCIVYPLPGCRDGKYELSIKLVDDESTVVNQRHFNIKLNGKYVVHEVDPLRLGNRCEGIEIIVLLEIYGDQTKLKLEGQEPVDIINGEIDIKFCYSRCGTTPSSAFQISAYSLQRLGDASQKTVPNICSAHNGNPCKCKHNEKCEYNVVSQTCKQRIPECNLCGFALLNECRRSDSWYASGGVLCRNTISRGLCKMEKSIIGVNLNGGFHIDVNGIPYTPSAYAPIYHIPNDIRYLNDKQVVGKPDADVALYESYAAGSDVSENLKVGDCLTYAVPLEEDGFYELSIKAGDFLHAESGKRSLNYRFNGIHVVEELDLIVHSGGTNKAINLNINFKVTDNGRILHLMGHPSSEIIGRQALVEFCPGGCQNTRTFQYMNWRVSAFSVIKFEDPTDADLNIEKSKSLCHLYNENPCGCRKAGCDYNVASDKCIKAERECGKSEAGKAESECRRPHSFYLDGGVICKNEHQRGICSFSEVVLAVNLAGGKQKDSHGIEHEAYSSKPPSYLPKGTNEHLEEEEINDPMLPLQDLPLYINFLYASKYFDTPNVECLKYDVPIGSDGSYELSIKVYDNWIKAKGKQSFSYKLNGLYLVRELDIMQYTITNLKAGNAMNLVVNFKVSGNRQTLHLPGYTDSAISNRVIVFEACNGMCTAYNHVPETQQFSGMAWHLSAFSVVRFGGEGERNDGNCQNYDSNACQCAINSCQYNVVKKKCTAGLPMCQHSFGLPSDCRRANSFYTEAGALCRNIAARGDCSKAKTAYAINMNGDTYRSSIGTYYIADSIPQNDDMISNSDFLTQFEHTCSAILDTGSSDSKKLYKTAVKGLANKADSKNCVSYTIPICEDGRYEMSIQTTEGEYTKTNQRRFNIKLAGRWIVNEVDLVELAGQSCKRVEIITLFEIVDGLSKIRIQGFSDKEISTPDIHLAFCYSECSVIDKSFLISAISVVRFGDAFGQDDCVAFDKNPCQCVRSKCDYNTYTKKCMKAKLECARCQFGEEEECRRPDAYYLDGGRPCRNSLDQGDCTVQKVIKAVNMGGSAVTVNGIDYEAYGTSLPSFTPNGIQLKRIGGGSIPSGESSLFETAILGRVLIGESSSCLVYNISLYDNAKYELAVKLRDYWFSSTGKRSMTLQFNGLNVIEELDLNLVGGVNTGFTLIVNFEVRGSSTVLRIPGHPNTAIENNAVQFKVCPGNCPREFDNHFWTINAFHIVQFKY